CARPEGVGGDVLAPCLFGDGVVIAELHQERRNAWWGDRVSRGHAAPSREPSGQQGTTTGLLSNLSDYFCKFSRIFWRARPTDLALKVSSRSGRCCSISRRTTSSDRCSGALPCGGYFSLSAAVRGSTFGLRLRLG